MRFVPLHIVSGYTFLSSGLTVDRIVKNVKKYLYPGAAIADYNVLYGVPEFVKGIKSIDKKYLIGETFIFDEDELSLFVLDETGYKNLLRLNLLNENDELSLDKLEQYQEGLLLILATNKGKFKSGFTSPVNIEFTRYLLKYAKIFKDRFYLGLDIQSREDIEYANKVRTFAYEYTYPLVAFPRIRYEKKEDAIVIDIVEAIKNDTKLDQNKKSEGSEHFFSLSDYQKIYRQSEIDNTEIILNKSQFEKKKKRGKMVKMHDVNAEENLRATTFVQLNRLNKADENHINRLNYELKIIHDLGYDDYFLVVADYVNYAKNHNILVGPGRGSAAGSLVSYLLNIIEIDPLDYNLQFERFLNPYRHTMPDIDVDFIDTKREEVVNYLKDKYGKNRVANIVTFQTILAKQSLRDIARVFNFDSRHIDLIIKKLDPKKNLSLRESYKQLPDFKALLDNDKYLLEIVSLASKIEFLPRQNGIAASGILLSEEPLDDIVPVSVDINGNYICNYEKDYIEEQGFLKMDILSLSNLSTIDQCLKLINARHPEENLTFNSIPYDDPKIFELISLNQTIGIFQIETRAMRNSIEILKPSNFLDVAALLSLGRPGPMKYIPNYARRKEGKEKINYVVKQLEPILKETYGIIIYQEQINQIATVMAGFSLSEADLFRRAISKKNVKELVNLKNDFINGSIKNGFSKIDSEKVFNNILSFAEYGFNKSHSIVYSVITCRMAYLKAYYPLEFYSALLQTGYSSSDNKMNEYILEMQRRNIAILLPNINESLTYFKITNNDLLMPLNSINYINTLLAEAIIKEREENGRYKDFFDFVVRLTKYKITDQQINSLIDAGCFDTLHPSRASLRATILSAKQFAKISTSDDGQLSIGIDSYETPLINTQEDDLMDNINREYDVLGVMISNNPINIHRPYLIEQGVIKIIDASINNNIKVCGIIKNKKVITTKKNEQMAFVTIFDETGDLEITVFPEKYKAYDQLLNKNDIIIVEGKVINRNNTKVLNVEKLERI